MATQDSENDLNKNNDISDNYSFTLLREEATDADSFEDKTHEKIAETLYKLIKNEKRGLTIGLEGTWGSGKSVVISILRKKLKDEQNISFFSFDAWAHEGDPLRRIFLESLIEELKDKKKNLEELQAKISKRIKHCDITSTKSVTGLGKALTVAAFFIPLGVGLMSKAEGVTFKLGGRPHWFFIIFSFIAIAPIWVLIWNLIRLLLRKTFSKKTVSENDDSKRIFAPSNWAFIQGESTEDVRQEVSEDEERSSIEFEKYFQEIMTIAFDDESNKKLVMVIDNLDRVDAQDSLKLWSTLQTFLQQRNTPSNKKDWFEKIWVVVPYDPEGLAKLWDKNEEKEEAPVNNLSNVKRKREISSQFFDKCFQLNLEVPKPILTAWERFTEDKINEAFPKWEINERNKVLEVLELTRKTLNDIPTPRQIKNYINQVGLLRVHSDRDIPAESIAYYVVQRILEKKSVDEIREKLLRKELPEQSIRTLMPPSCDRDMAGLVFGVSPIKGQQLLIEPDIQMALESANGEILKELQEKYQNGFWAVFFYHITNRPISLLSYSVAIHEGLWKLFKNKLKAFSKRANKILNETKGELWPWPNDKDIKSYVYLSDILDNPTSCEFLYERFIISLNAEIKNNNNFDNIVDVFSRLNEIFKINKQYKLNALTLDKFIQWSQASLKLEVPVWKWIVPNELLANQISGKIPVGGAISPGLWDAFVYLVKANPSEDWSGLITACHKHIVYNNGNGNNNTHSKEIFEILFMLAFRFDAYNEGIKAIITDWRSHNIAWTLNRVITPSVALLCGKYYGNQINSLPTSPNQPNAAAFVNTLKIYWNSRNEVNAKAILNLLKEYNKWDFLWNLAEDPNNKLVADIILLALKDDDAKGLFEISNGLRKIKSYFDLLGQNKNESFDLLVEAIIENSPLEDGIIQDAELNIINSSIELYYVTAYSDNDQFITFLESKTKELSKETWSDAFKRNLHLIGLAIEIKEKHQLFGLDNNYADAFTDFAKNNAKGTSALIEWHIKSWQKLVSLMSDAFQEEYKKDITRYLLDEYEEVNNEYITLNSRYFDYSKICKEEEIIQDIFAKAIDEKDFSRLKWLNESVLSSSFDKKFKPQKQFPEVIKKPLNNLFRQEQDKANIALIKELAGKFHVEITKEVIEEENDGLVKTIVNNKWRLFFNPAKGAGASKIMRFDKGGIILEGKNDNESSWRIQNDHLELVDSDGKVHGRFKYDSKTNRFNHTNEPDTGAIIKHSIRDQYLVVEAN